MEKHSSYEPAQQYLMVLLALADQKVTAPAVASAVQAYQAGKSHCMVAWLLEQRHLSSAAIEQYAQAAASQLHDLNRQSKSENSLEWALPRSIPKLEQIVSGQTTGTPEKAPAVKAEKHPEKKATVAPTSHHQESVSVHAKAQHASESRKKRSFDDDGSYEDISGHLEAEVLQPHHRFDLFLRNLTFGYIGFNHFLLALLTLLIVGLIWFLFFL
jgi:hypothetical protein